MKKGTVIALIVACVLIFVGAVILVLGLSFAGDGAKESALTKQEVSVAESFTDIQIDTEDFEVVLVPGDGTTSRVVIQAHEDTRHDVLVIDSTLKIELQDNRNWTDRIGIFWEPMVITVYLPQKQYETLSVRTATGDVKIPAEFSAKEAMLRSNTGEIDCCGKISQTLDCMTSTGDISVHDSAPVLIKLQSSTGDIGMSLVEADEIHAQTSTGEVDGQKVSAQIFTAKSSTGEMELEQVIAADYLQIRTTTGDVGIENCDAGRVDIETDTGDVYGNFLTPKWFSAHSDTGNVDVPSSPGGEDCRIETDTGNITFFYDGSQNIA